MSTHAEMIAENNRRLKEWNAVYNPITGEGCNACERKELIILGVKDRVHYLPVKMFNEDIVKLLVKYKSFKEVSKVVNKGKTKKISIKELQLWFIKIRIKYDFEYWAFCYIKIRPKDSVKAGGTSIPFLLNRGQRKYLKELLAEWQASKPIRINLVKARQWGGSTLTQIFMLWIQMVHYMGCNSVICAHIENAARTIRGMYTKALREYPFQLTDGATKTMELIPYEGSSKTRQLVERDCTISIGSSEQPDGLRSENIKLAHFSEVAFYKKTENKTPDDLTQSIEGSVPETVGSMVVYESSAKGVGNFWHRRCLASKKNKTGYTLVFVSWIDNENNFVEIENYEEFIRTMDSYEKYLWSLGATLEQINWYRIKLASLNGDKQRMMSEYPSTFIEAFQSTGNRYYPISEVERLRQTCVEPKFIGDIIGSDTHSREALKDIRFVEGGQNFMKIWEKPDDVYMSNRYCVVVDVNRGMTSKADNGVICVFDRYWQSEGGVPEVVAEWCGHIMMRYFIWKAVQIAEWYQHAFLIIESNTPDSTQAINPGFEMDSVMDEIAGYYDNLYCRTPSSQVVQGRPRKWGFQTNRSSKLMVCTHHQKVLHEDLYIERCIDAADEHDTFESKPNGSLGAVDGCHDDRHITRAIGVWACYNVMGAVKSRENFSLSIGSRVVNEASM